MDCTCRQPKALNLPVAEFRARACQPVLAVDRRGKSIELALESGSLWVHLGLNGQVLCDAAGAPPPAAEPMVGFLLDDGSRVRLERIFMGHSHWLSAEQSTERRAQLGIDPLGPSWGEEFLATLAIRRPGVALKAIICDQSVIGGIGNSYADEILFAARLLPNRRLGSLSAVEISQLAVAVPQALAGSLALGGDNTYTGVDGVAGRYETAIHSRETCPLCASAVDRLGPSGRGAFYCPRCQR